MEPKIDSSNFNKMCRTCLTERKKMQPLFECSMASMLMSFTSVQASKDDGLPSIICVQCLRQISRAFSFKQQCEQSESSLRKYLKEQNGSDSHDMAEIQLDPPNNGDVTNVSTELSTEYIKTPHIELPEYNKEEGIARTADDLLYVKAKPARGRSKTHDLSDSVWKYYERPRDSPKSRLHKCYKCYKDFSRASQLISHMNTHNGKSTSEVCDTCGKKFTSLHSLNRHQKLVHSIDRPYVCQVCAKGFLFQGGLEIHLRRHRDERPYACPVEKCGKKFIRQQVLKVHMLLHSGEKNYVCKYCDKRFTQSTSLKVHEKIHTGERPHLCSLCAKRFIQASQLKVHVQRHHSTEHPQLRAKCIVCEKQFRGSYELKVHMRKHTGDRPFGCEVCQQRFAAKKGVQRHMLVHSDLREHVCTICDKAFKVAKTLTIHMRTHTGERPYGCDICGQRFAQSSTRNTHLKTHNGESFVNVAQSTTATNIANSNSSTDNIQTLFIDHSIIY